ncbi:MAG: endonuclease III [Lachnospiraceae bacterium]|nr:endonuclease III [Lachnospiraceae bacterium]
MNRKTLALKVIELLKQEYPVTDCTLTYDEAWKLLVSVRLAAQCTDARVNEITPVLFAAYPGIRELSDADVDDIERIVRPCGLGKSKARDISLCMKALRDNFCGRVPDNMEDLLSLPGVGRKSANLIMGDIYKKPAIVCDTHCIRLTNRIGLVHDTKDPKKVEMELWKIIPPEESNDFCHRLVDHGRAVCQARTAPDCAHCVLRDICERNI